MAAIFVNYRSVDESGTAALLERELSRVFGEDAVFLAGKIPPGDDFEVELLRRVRGCEVLLAVVGPRWFTARHSDGGRAIDHEDDWVRRELAEAFACGARVVPILVNNTERLTNATLPDDIQQLTTLQYRYLRHKHAGQDLAKIVEDLVEHVPALRRLYHKLLPARAGSAAIPVEDAVLDDGPLLATVLRDGFTGRAWVIEQIDAFLRTRPCGYVWIEGDAGVGKTALAAQLVRERGWIGHFVRLPRGGSVRVGLRNLAGRLAERYGLAEAGMLSERASTPDGFGALLGRAAARAEGPVVLVVDGADESEPALDTQPWGLPNLLPDGVYVIGTYRTGSPPPRCDAPCAVVRIAADDPRNRTDVVEHLRSVLPRQRADALAEGCGGVWIYLRYVLDEIRLGVRHDLTDLPVDLPAFYAASLDRWRADPQWQGGLLPVLATLAVAGEPLPTHTLATLAAVPEQLVRQWCHTVLRPFLNATPTNPRGFEIYHASLREFLIGATPGPEAPEQAWLWAETLRSAAGAAYERIAVRSLSEIDRAPAAISGYALRQLRRHLLHTGRMADLHRVLGVTHRVGDRIVNSWFAAHDDADTLEDYLDDVTASQLDAEVRTELSLAALEPAATLADELRYHLIAASITSRTTGIPIDLLVALLREGVWTPARALAHARRLPTPAARAAALTALVPHLPPGERAAAVERALAAASAGAAGYSRVDALIRVAAHLPDDRRRPILEEALAVTAVVAGARQRAELLRDLAALLPRDLLETALAAADALAADAPRALALTALAPCLPAERRQAAFARALSAASVISSEHDRAHAVIDLAPHLPEEALVISRSITSDRYRAGMVGSIAAHLPEPRRSDLLRGALVAARGIPTAGSPPFVSPWVSTGHYRAEALTALLPHLPESQVDSVRSQALAAARTVQPPRVRAELLVELARHNASVAAEALTAALAVKPEPSRAALLTALAPRLPTRQRRAALTEALAAAMTIATDYRRIAELVNAPDAPAREAATTEHDRVNIDREFGDWLTEALAVAATGTTAHVRSDNGARPADTVPVAMATVDVHARIRRLAKLAPYLPPGERADVMAQQLSELSSAADDPARARSLAAVAPHLPAGHVGSALELAAASTADVSRVVGRLIPLLTTAAQLSQALELVAGQDRDLLCALLIRAGEVVEPGPEYVALLRRTLWSVGRDTCLALLAIAVPHLREIAGADFNARTWVALCDVHTWWP